MSISISISIIVDKLYNRGMISFLFRTKTVGVTNLCTQLHNTRVIKFNFYVFCLILRIYICICEAPLHTDKVSLFTLTRY